MVAQIIRKAAHARSWYTADPVELQAQLQAWMGGVKDLKADHRPRAILVP